MNDVMCRMEEKWNTGAPNYDKTHVDNEKLQLTIQKLSRSST